MEKRNLYMSYVLYIHISKELNVCSTIKIRYSWVMGYKKYLYDYQI